MKQIKQKKKIKDIKLMQNKVLFNWIKDNYGPRCPDFEKECACCIAWNLYDRLIQKTDLKI